MEPNYRRCVVCRRVAQKQEFWRIVRVHPSQEVLVNQGSGRSAYLCPQADCLKAAQKKNRLGRSLKTAVPDSVYGELWNHLHQSARSSNISPDDKTTANP